VGDCGIGNCSFFPAVVETYIRIFSLNGITASFVEYRLQYIVAQLVLPDSKIDSQDENPDCLQVTGVALNCISLYKAGRQPLALEYNLSNAHEVLYYAWLPSKGCTSFSSKKMYTPPSLLFYQTDFYHTHGVAVQSS